MDPTNNNPNNYNLDPNNVFNIDYDYLKKRRGLYYTAIENNKPYRCNARLEDVMQGMPFETDGSITRLMKCFFNMSGHESLRYSYLDKDSVDRALGKTTLPVEYFNIKDGYGSDRDIEIIRQYFEENPQHSDKEKNIKKFLEKETTTEEK